MLGSLDVKYALQILIWIRNELLYWKKFDNPESRSTQPNPYVLGWVKFI